MTFRRTFREFPNLATESCRPSGPSRGRRVLTDVSDKESCGDEGKKSKVSSGGGARCREGRGAGPRRAKRAFLDNFSAFSFFSFQFSCLTRPLFLPSSPRPLDGRRLVDSSSQGSRRDVGRAEPQIPPAHQRIGLTVPICHLIKDCRK